MAGRSPLGFSCASGLTFSGLAFSGFALAFVTMLATYAFWYQFTETFLG
jgi:hypothetical protein